jgi:hypothetical protein
MEFKHIAPPADKIDLSFNPIMHLTAAVINSQSTSTGLSPSFGAMVIAGLP